MGSVGQSETTDKTRDEVRHPARSPGSPRPLHHCGGPYKAIDPAGTDILIRDARDVEKKKERKKKNKSRGKKRMSGKKKKNYQRTRQSNRKEKRKGKGGKKGNGKV